MSASTMMGLMDANVFSQIIGDRRNLEQETTGVRLIAAIAFSLIIFVLFVVAIFFGFASAETRLFLLGLGHLVLAPVACYASLRLGFALILSLVLAVVVLILDLVQLMIRVFGLPLSFLGFIAILFVVAFVFIDIVYVAFLYRLRTTDLAQNNRKTDADVVLRNANVLRQEANTLRLAAIFGAVAWFFLFVFVTIFLGYSTPTTSLTLLSLGHIILAGWALFLVTLGSVSAVVFFGLATAQTVLDVVQLIMRFSTISGGVLGTLTLDSIFSVVLLLINVGFIVLDAVYVIAGFGYAYARLSTNVDDLEALLQNTDEFDKRQAASDSTTTLSAYNVRQRHADSAKEK